MKSSPFSLLFLALGVTCGASPQTNAPQSEARKATIDALASSDVVSKNISNAFRLFFADESLPLEKVRGSGILAESPSLLEKYREMKFDDIANDLKAKEKQLGKKARVIVDSVRVDTNEYLVVTAYVVIAKGDIVLECARRFHFRFSPTHRLARVEWGASSNREIHLPKKANQ